MIDPKNPAQALALAYWLAVTAGKDRQAQELSDMAESIAEGMDPIHVAIVQDVLEVSLSISCPKS
tara:strand:+ start:834 stop:1028 length:195 start_codon:yes stop_codon:yes gene_type:complete